MARPVSAKQWIHAAGNMNAPRAAGNGQRPFPEYSCRVVQRDRVGQPELAAPAHGLDARRVLRFTLQALAVLRRQFVPRRPVAVGFAFPHRPLAGVLVCLRLPELAGDGGFDVGLRRP